MRLLAFIGIGLWACGSSRSRTSPDPEGPTGVYRFSERVPEIPALTLEGEITVLEDTVLVRATPGPCNYEVLRSSPTEVVYQCGEVTLSFDRLDPVQRARYTIITLVTERRQVCVQYATDAGGRRVCVQSRTEVFERQVPVSRTLRPRRVDGPPVPAHGRRSARARR